MSKPVEFSAADMLRLIDPRVREFTLDAMEKAALYDYEYGTPVSFCVSYLTEEGTVRKYLHVKQMEYKGNYHVFVADTETSPEGTAVGEQIFKNEKEAFLAFINRHLAVDPALPA